MLQPGLEKVTLSGRAFAQKIATLLNDAIPDSVHEAVFLDNKTVSINRDDNVVLIVDVQDILGQTQITATINPGFPFTTVSGGVYFAVATDTEMVSAQLDKISGKVTYSVTPLPSRKEYSLPEERAA